MASMTPELQASKAIIKALNQLSLDPDMLAYSFTQGASGGDMAMQLRMADFTMALNRVYAGWHASGYSAGTPLAGVCEQAYTYMTANGMEF